MKKQSTDDNSFSDEREGRGVSLYGSAVEYALHCLLWLVPSRETPASSRDLAELTGVSPALVAKLLPKLEKAGVLEAQGGIAGGYRLARPAGQITVLDVVDAVDGGKHLFDCKDVRVKCPLFGGDPPTWASRGLCSIHAVMLRAEKSMRREMAQTTLLDLANAVGVKALDIFSNEIERWLDDRVATREHARVAAIRNSTQRRSVEG
jgi:Rrf2 family protein